MALPPPLDDTVRPQLAGSFNYVAVAWLALQLTGSSLTVGSVLAVAAVPQVVLMLLGGAVSDRLSPKTAMVGPRLAGQR